MSDPDLSPDPRKPGLSWLMVALLVGVLLALPIALDQGKPPDHAFKRELLAALQKKRPAGVFIGDSMLETRIDPKTLDGLTDEPWYVMAQPGGSSAVWYLMMKNFITQLSPPPRRVIVFFRELQLTLPAHRTDAGHRAMIEGYMRGDELRVEALIKSAQERNRWWLERLADRLYPVQEQRESWHERVQGLALDAVASSREYEGIRAGAAEIFDLKNLRTDRRIHEQNNQDAALGKDAEKATFADAIEDSFLPAILEMAREKNIELIFVRVKRRPLSVDQPAVEQPSWAAYQESLRSYLEQNGAKLVDETRDADVTLDFYTSDDHIQPSKIEAYTKLFWRKLAPHIAPSPAPAKGER